MITMKGMITRNATPFPISLPRAVFIRIDLIKIAVTVPIQEAEVVTSITIKRIMIV